MASGLIRVGFDSIRILKRGKSDESPFSFQYIAVAERSVLNELSRKIWGTRLEFLGR